MYLYKLAENFEFSFSSKLYSTVPVNYLKQIFPNSTFTLLWCVEAIVDCSGGGAGTVPVLTSRRLIIFTNEAQWSEYN